MQMVVGFCPRAGKNIQFVKLYKKNGGELQNQIPLDPALVKTVCPEAEHCNSKRCSLNQY